MSATVEIRTADLIGPALDWCVATAIGMKEFGIWSSGYVYDNSKSYENDEDFFFCPSENWSQGGPLIFDGLISLIYWPTDAPKARGVYRAFFRCDGPEFEHESALIAGLRALVESSLGDTVQVPAELAGGAK